MKQRWLNLTAVLALAAAAAACDGPRNAPSRSVVSPRPDLLSSTGQTLFTTDVGWEDGEVTRTALIDERGGKLNFIAGSLSVPPNAVSGPTQFTVTFHNSPYMRTQLQAIGPDGLPITVFPTPLSLTLSYARAKTLIPDESKITIFWVDNGVVLERETTNVDVQGKKVTAAINHFTEYVPGTERSDNDTTRVGP